MGKIGLIFDPRVKPQITRIYHGCEGRIEKSVPRITVWHYEACRVMTNCDPEGQISLTRIMDSSSCSPKYTTFYS